MSIVYPAVQNPAYITLPASSLPVATSERKAERLSPKVSSLTGAGVTGGLLAWFFHHTATRDQTVERTLQEIKNNPPNTQIANQIRKMSAEELARYTKIAFRLATGTMGLIGATIGALLGLGVAKIANRTKN